MAERLFIAGIDTDAGKSVVAALFVEALQADYWKPIQSGDLDFGDSDRVRSWVSNEQSVFHPEAYRLKTPASPHYSAALDGLRIDPKSIQLPETENDLIVEGAGGLLVPLNEKDLLIDLIADLGLEVVLVSRNYLGSINHSLLSIEALQRRNIPIRGIVFNGPATPSSSSYIVQYSKTQQLFHLPELTKVDAQQLRPHALELRKIWKTKN